MRYYFLTMGNNWEKVYSVDQNLSDVSFIKLTEAEARYLKINLLKSSSENSFGIKEISFLDIKNSLTVNDFLMYVAKIFSKGRFSKIFFGTGFLLDNCRCK